MAILRAATSVTGLDRCTMTLPHVALLTTVDLSVCSLGPFAVALTQAAPINISFQQCRDAYHHSAVELSTAACSNMGDQATLYHACEKLLSFEPAALSVDIAMQSFTALIYTGAATSCILETIRHHPKKVLVPLPRGQFLRMHSSELVHPLRCCRMSVLMGGYTFVVLFTVLKECVADIIFGWDLFIIQQSTNRLCKP